MKLKALRRYYTDWGAFQGWDILIFRSKLFQLRWFTDCGGWFIYIHLGKRYCRFSGCGFLKGKE